MAIDEIMNKLGEGTSPSAVQVGRLSGLPAGDAGPFLTGWAKLSTERRQKILRLAVQLAEDDIEMDFGTIFKTCLSDSDPQVRATAIEGLWEDEEFRTADRLAVVLRQDPDENVRIATALCLAHFALLSELGRLYAPSAARVRAALLSAVSDASESAEVRRRAVEALGVFGDAEVADLIATAYADTIPKMRASAVYAMGQTGDERWLPTILKEMENENPELRYEAARAAGQLENGRVLVPLITLLNDEDLEVRLAAIGSLGECGGDVARRALIQCAKSEDAAVRDAAREALAQLDVGADPLSISPFLDDSTPTV